MIKAEGFATTTVTSGTPTLGISATYGGSSIGTCTMAEANGSGGMGDWKILLVGAGGTSKQHGSCTLSLMEPTDGAGASTARGGITASADLAIDSTAAQTLTITAVAGANSVVSVPDAVVWFYEE